VAYEKRELCVDIHSTLYQRNDRKYKILVCAERQRGRESMHHGAWKGAGQAKYSHDMGWIRNAR
jgi:hypothetical protein